MPNPAEVTQLLQQWSEGNHSVVNELTPIVYDELHRLASGYMGRERAGHTLQPTALIHEAFMRLMGQQQPSWDSRSHFYGFAARLMRQILVDHARSKRAVKRGGDQQKQTLDDVVLIHPQQSVDLLALDEALDRLATEDQRCCDVVVMKFFSGMTEEQTGEALTISVATVRRKLRFAEKRLALLLQGEG